METIRNEVRRKCWNRLTLMRKHVFELKMQILTSAMTFFDDESVTVSNRNDVKLNICYA